MCYLGLMVAGVLLHALSALQRKLAIGTGKFRVLGQGFVFREVLECLGSSWTRRGGSVAQEIRLATALRAVSLVDISFDAFVAFFSQSLRGGEGCVSVGLPVAGFGDSALVKLAFEFIA